MIFNIRKKPTPKAGDIRVKDEFVLYRRIDDNTVVVLERVVTVRYYKLYKQYEIWSSCKEGYWEILHSELPEFDIELQIERLRKRYDRSKNKRDS